MTATQLSIILKNINSDYSLDSNISLSEVSSIYLTTDGCLYPNENTLFNFHKIDSGGILLIYSGEYNSDGSFVVKSDIPDAFISFDVIAGFTLINKINPSKPYIIGKAV